MTIPEDIVNRLNDLPIEEVAGRLGITIKNHKSLCFMHDDHSPSLKFSVKKNMFFCFVCNKGGGPIQLVQEHEGWTFQEACVWLADIFKIWWPVEKTYKKPFKKTIRKAYLPKTEIDKIILDEEVHSWLIDNAALSDSARIRGTGQELSYTLGTQYIDLWSSSSLQGIAQTSLDSAPASFVTSLKQIA